MSNTTLTADIIAKEALAILDNELSWLGRIHRAYEDEFDKKVNGYKVGETISIRRPEDGRVRTGATLDPTDVIEGKVTLTINQQIGSDFQFSSTDLTLKIDDLSERVIKPRMINIVNHVAQDVLNVAYRGAYNWVGTPGQYMNSFADFMKPVTRMNEMAIPMNDRLAILSPEDHGYMVGSNTALFAPNAVTSALREGELGKIAGVSTYMSQVTPTHICGTRDNSTPLTDGVSQNVTYDTAKNTWSQTLITDGWDSSATIKAGDVFTIDGFYMVNPKTKAATNILQEFVVLSDVTANETTSADTNLTISPPIITSGPHQTVTYSGTTNDRTITMFGTASNSYRQNLFMHKNAMALAVVPMEMPAAAYGGARQSHKGFSVRVIPIYDGTNDISKWRLDLLYGRALIDPRLIVRSSGAS
jgi:hypothetical protein